jgi:hypothetical protein
MYPCATGRVTARCWRPCPLLKGEGSFHGHRVAVTPAVTAQWTGGSMSDGAWIGAAAGASVGFLIGFVVGRAEAGSGFSTELAAPPPCPPALAEAAAVTEDNIDTEGTK